MKVRVIQKPTYQYGGARYDPLQYSVQDVMGMGVGTLQTGLGIANIIDGLSPDKAKTTAPQTGTSAMLNDWKGFNHNPKINSGILSGYRGLHGASTPTTSPLHYQEGGEAKATDPQLLAAYKSIASSLEQGADPYSVIDEFVNTGMSQDDAQSLVAQVMEYLDPTAEASMPQAQMGGAQTGMNAGMFAGQSQNAYIVKKPLMKDGGQTFVTSQPAYTKKSHTYFGTSNAPARDSYTDNEQIVTSVKAVPREDATIEAEKGEYIFSDGGLYKIEGKKHYEGGTPLAAKGGEFIFSAHKDMSLDPKLQKQAGLKVHPSKALVEHTPAKVLERNVNVKEYNRLKAILGNPKSDPVTKKTAQFMLDKMHNKIDVIAKLQEGKKQPKPVEVEDQYLEQNQVQNEINEQKQYAHGGLTTYQDAGNVTKTEISENVILNDIDKTIDKIKDPKLKEKAQILMNQNLNYSPLVRLHLLNQYVSEGGGSGLLSLSNSEDPRAEADVEKLIPFYGEDANGFWDWAGTLANTGVKSVNNILTGEYELPHQFLEREYPNSPTLVNVASDFVLDPLLYNTVGKVNRLAKGITPAMEAAKALELGTKIGKTGSWAVRYPAEAISKLANWLPKNWTKYGYVAAPYVAGRIGSYANEAMLIKEIQRLQNKKNKTPEEEAQLQQAADTLGVPTDVPLLSEPTIVADSTNNKPSVTATPVATAPSNPSPAKERVYTRTISHYEPSTEKYENTDFDQNGKVLKEYTTDYKVGTTDSPNYKKQLGGYFAMGGLNQYQPGGTAQPTYYNDTNTGLRVGRNKQGVPGLYRGDKSIFDVYYNPKDITATGKNASFKGVGDKPDYVAGANQLSDIIKSMTEAGVDFSDVNTGEDFQKKMYDWRLKNDPDSLKYLWETTGATNNVMKYPKLKGQLEALGVKTTNADKNYTMDFEGMDPSKRMEALSLLKDYFPDNYVGLRSIGAYNKPTIPTTPNTVKGKIAPIEFAPEKGPRIKPLDFEEPSIPIEGGDFDIQDPYGKVGAWQNAQYWNALRKARFTYTPPIEQPNTIFTPMSRQPFEDEAGRARYSSNQLASKFGDMTGKQMAAAQQNQQINKALFDVEKYNTEGYNQNYNENLLRNAAKVNQFNQMAKTVHDQNNLAQDKTDEANAFAFNQYAAARQKDLLNKYYADRDLQTAMLPYASTYDTTDAYGRPVRRVAYPVYPGGRFNPNWNGWNTNATNQFTADNSTSKLLKEIDDTPMPADKKLELKIKALRGEK